MRVVFFLFMLGLSLHHTSRFWGQSLYPSRDQWRWSVQWPMSLRSLSTRRSLVNRLRPRTSFTRILMVQWNHACLVPDTEFWWEDVPSVMPQYDWHFGRSLATMIWRIIHISYHLFLDDWSLIWYLILWVCDNWLKWFFANDVFWWYDLMIWCDLMVWYFDMIWYVICDMWYVMWWLEFVWFDMIWNSCTIRYGPWNDLFWYEWKIWIMNYLRIMNHESWNLNLFWNLSI